MTFRTELTVAPVAVPLPTSARVLTIGSCFAAVLAQKLAATKLSVLENPFGTVLNPVSACRLLAVAAGADEYDLTERTIQRDGRWFSYDAPSALSGATFEELQAVLDERLTEVRDFVRSADALVLTMGTAWAWRLDGEVVANCHKQPGGLFQKTLLSVQEIVTAFAEMHSWLLRLNPKLRVVLTVSPVRHPKETLPGSSVSKSTLRLACHHLAGLVREVTYFPAYELLLDDLRDYRFFAADMLHPSALAEEYIFDKFAGAYFDARFPAVRAAWEEIQRAMAHRSANPAGEAHQQFLLATLAKLDALGAEGVDVSKEIASLESQLVRPRRAMAPPAMLVQKPEPAASAPVSAPIKAADKAPENSPAAPAPTGGPKPVTGSPAAAAGDTPRPIKPIIKIELRPLPPRPDRDRNNPNSRNQPPLPPRPPRTVVKVEMPDEKGKTIPGNLPVEAASEVENQLENNQSLNPESVAAPESAGASAAATPSAETTGKKRRGRRGGRRHKQRRDEEVSASGFDLAALPAQADLLSALEVESQAAAETAITPVLPVQAPAGMGADVPQPPAEEVAAENAFSVEASRVAEAESNQRPLAAPGARRSSRGSRGKGGKKLTLQKVKPDSKPAGTMTPPEAGVPAAPLPVAPAASPLPASPPARRGRDRDRDRQNRPQTPQTAPVEVALAPPAAPSAPPASTPTATPPPVASPAPSPVAKPAKQQSMNARTPGRSSGKGPVATPVERAAAARATKKAGVGALLAALGGSAALPIPAPVAPAAALAPAAVPAPAPAPTVAAPAVPAPVVAPESAKPTAKKVAPAKAKTATKATPKTAKTAKPTAPPAPNPVEASPVSESAPQPVAPVAVPTKAAPKPTRPKAPAKGTAQPVAAPTPEPASEPVAKRPTKPRTPKTK